MKVIGLIGGMSWNSTLEYYRLINEGVFDRLGGFHSARIVMYSLDFAEIEYAQHRNNWDSAAHILIEAGMALKYAGADLLVICTNTMHKIADQVAEKVGLPLLHIVDVIGSAIRVHGLHKIGLLGTKFVMEGDFYQERLRDDFQIDVVVPTLFERTMVHNIIYKELCQGKIIDTSRNACLEIIESLIERGVEGIILGCTELPLLISPNDVNIPVFDTTRLHAEATVEEALAE